jgi:phosphatidylinositol alpha-mannosyltransferase
VRIGIVCPYSLDRPGGVQLHVTSLAEALIDRGHDVRVLAPSAPGMPVPGFVDPAGRSVALSYNGSTARIKFGLFAAGRVRDWLFHGGYDVVHLHEPGAPSLALLAMWARIGPTVATFHSSNDSSRVMRLAKPFIKPGMEVLDARIAVSPSADRTVREHLRLSATHIIPNGVDTRSLIDARPRPAWKGTTAAPTVGILGRMDEPRKGLDVFLKAIPAIRKEFRGARFLVAGRYSTRTANRIRAAGAESVGELDEALKMRFMASVDVYCAPNTGGESFGIVLVEAMAAGAACVASDLAAFRDVATAHGGEPCAALHRVGDADDLAKAVKRLLRDPVARKDLAKRGRQCSRLFDWENVAPRVEETYIEAIRMYEQAQSPGE